MRARPLFIAAMLCWLAAPGFGQQTGETGGAPASDATWRGNTDSAPPSPSAAPAPAAAMPAQPIALSATQPAPQPTALSPVATQTSGGSTGRLSPIPSSPPSSAPSSAPNPASSPANFNPVRSQLSPTDDAGRTSTRTFAPPPAAGTVSQGQPPARTSGESLRRARMTRVTTGSGSLPNEQGQLYREYDISPYTARITTTKRPEQAIVDWILRETGYETWHSEPLAILSATSQVLRVYHTVQVHAVVADIVDRFNSNDAEAQAFSLRLVTVDSPDWRVRVQRLLNPVAVQTPGVQAWLLEKEAAAVLLTELRRRSDYREHNSPQLLVNNGQPTVVSAMRGRNYIRAVRLRSDAWPGYEPEAAQVDEGFTLEFTPLMALDGKTVDATIKCDVDQVERLIPVMLSVPTVAAPRQSAKIEVPQVIQFRFHERFRWPLEQVLVIGLGVVAVPVPRENKSLVPGIPLPINAGPPRADLLVFVENKGKASQQAPRVTRGGATANDYLRGR
jgi:hypothetical protein